MAFHLAPGGPKPCSVDPQNPNSRGCKYETEHYSDFAEAKRAYERDLEEELGDQLRGVSSATDGESQVSSVILSTGELSAEQSRAYAHWSVANDHLHDGSDPGSPQELYYYSSAQGALELQRRLTRSGSSSRYSAIREELESFDPQSFDPRIDSEELNASIALGQSMLQADSSYLSSKDRRNRKDPALRHYLVEESHRWLSRLSPEEQEEVSYLTSDGFLTLRYALGRAPEREELRLPRGLVDEDRIYEAHGADYEAAESEIAHAKASIAASKLQTVRELFHRAPKLPTPTVVGRGASTIELHGVLGLPLDHRGQRELFDSIEGGSWNGRAVAQDSSLRQLPTSASLHGGVARRFSKASWNSENTDDRAIILAIHSRTMASPANVSAWGTAELEVYTNPLSDYRVRGGRRVGENSGDEQSYFVLEIEEL